MICCVCMYVLSEKFCYYVFFFFKQKTAYEMRISDWSSDVCSSDPLFVGKGHPVLDQCVCERQQLLPRRRVACHWTQPFGKATLMRRRILRRIVAKDASSQSPSGRISPASISSRSPITTSRAASSSWHQPSSAFSRAWDSSRATNVSTAVRRSEEHTSTQHK